MGLIHFVHLPVLSRRLQPLARQPFLHLVDVDHVVPFHRRVFAGHDHADTGVDAVGTGGEHLVDGLLVLVDIRLQQAHTEVAHLVRVLADGHIDRALGQVVDGRLVQVEGDNGDFLAKVGELGDLLGDEVSVVRPEAEINARLGILADRGLDVGLGPGLVGSVLEDLEGILLRRDPEGVARAGEEALWRRSLAFAAAAVPTKATVLPPCGRNVLATLPATSPALRLNVPI